MADENKADEKIGERGIPAEEGAGSLDAFLAPPSPAKPEGEKKEEVKEEVKEPVKEEVKEPEKEPEVPVKAEDKDAAGPAKKPVKEPVKEPEKKPEELKADWESDANPYKKRHRDTANYATDLNKRQQAQAREILILQKKADGTYDEELDNPKRTEEQIETEAESKGRAVASHESAIATWGAEVVEKDLAKFNEVFRDDVYMLGSVASADQPVVAAINALRRYEFHQEFGNIPEEIVEKIGKRAVEKAGQTIQSDEAKKLVERVKVADGEAKGLAGLTSKGTETRKEEATVKPLSEEFDN